MGPAVDPRLGFDARPGWTSRSAGHRSPAATSRCSRTGVPSLRDQPSEPILEAPSWGCRIRPVPRPAPVVQEQECPVGRSRGAPMSEGRKPSRRRSSSRCGTSSGSTAVGDPPGPPSRAQTAATRGGLAGSPYGVGPRADRPDNPPAPGRRPTPTKSSSGIVWQSANSTRQDARGPARPPVGTRRVGRLPRGVGVGVLGQPGRPGGLGQGPEGRLEVVPPSLSRSPRSPRDSRRRSNATSSSGRSTYSRRKPAAAARR